MAGKINRKSIAKAIFTNRQVKAAVANRYQKELEKQKLLFLKEYESHPVTKELDGGEDASNVSGTLGGYGNLFSFLGFSKADNPTAPVKNLIRSIRLDKNVQSSNETFKVKINIPSKEEFAAATRMPWETGRSWLLDMERGISGLGAYLYGKFNASRSGTGIQNQKNYSGRTFRPVKYFSQIYNNFLKRTGVK